MALVRKPTYNITINLEDRDKNTSTLTFYVNITNTIVEIITAVENVIIPRLIDLTNAIVRGWTISTSAEEDDNVLAPEPSDVQRKGVFSFSAANGASYVIAVPSIRNDLVVDRTNVLDTSNPLVSSFVDMIVSEAVLALVRPRTYLGSDIRRLEKAVKHHRRSNKG